MDLMEIEMQKLALMKREVTLLPSSLAVKDLHNGCLQIDLNYALVPVKVLVAMRNPIDFKVLSTDMLPMSALIKFYNTDLKAGLAEVVDNLVNALRLYHQTLLRGNLIRSIPLALASLTEFYPSTKYELAVLPDCTNLLISFEPEEKITLCNVESFFADDKLVSLNGYRYTIKMAFEAGKLVPESICVLWNKELTEMLPELSEVEFNGSSFAGKILDIVLEIKETLECGLKTAVGAWHDRAKVLLGIKNGFADESAIAVQLDLLKMTGVDIVFRTKSKTHVYTVTMYTGLNSGSGRIVYRSRTQEGIETTMKLIEFTKIDLQQQDINHELLKLIRSKVDTDSV